MGAATRAAPSLRSAPVRWGRRMRSSAISSAPGLLAIAAVAAKRFATALAIVAIFLLSISHVETDHGAHSLGSPATGYAHVSASATHAPISPGMTGLAAFDCCVSCAAPAPNGGVIMRAALPAPAAAIATQQAVRGHDPTLATPPPRNG